MPNLLSAALLVNWPKGHRLHLIHLAVASAQQHRFIKKRIWLNKI